MGRNKNKHNRSAARKQPPTLHAGGSRKDVGLPSFFKQRKQEVDRSQNGALASDARQRRTGGDDMAMEESDSLLRQLASHANAQQDVKGHDRRSAAAILASTSFEKASNDLALSGKRDSSVKAFMRDVKNVIENSDVLLQVLDARDPLGSRSKQTEVMAMGHGKKVVLVLNKVDLIPVSNLQAWLRYLRNDFPTLAFKSSTQQQRTHLKQGRGEIDIPQQHGEKEKLTYGAEAIGATALLQLLKNYARTAVKGSNLKQQLTVGVVGPPNVGKSSLINSLLRTRACAVASTPGWTKVVQGVMLEKGIRLLDCPGVVVSGGVMGGPAGVDGEEEESKDALAWSMLRNTVKVELLEDPIAPVQAILKRVDDEQLVKLYNIEGGFNEGDTYDFLLRVALLRGKLAKGGVPDLEGAARIVLHDWNIGRISFHSTPPVVHPSMMKQHQEPQPEQQMRVTSAERAPENVVPEMTMGSSLVSGFSEAFDIEALLGQADAEAMGFSGATGQGGRDLVEARERVYASEKEVEPIAEDTEEQEGKADEEAEQANVSRSSLGKRQRGFDDMLSSSSSSSSDDEDEGDADDDDVSLDNDSTVHALNGAQKDGVLQPPRGRLTASRDVAIEATGAKREPTLSRQQRELQRALGEHEVASMARKRGEVRRSAKKEQKRLRRSGAGLVDIWTSGMALEEDGGERAQEEGTPPPPQQHRQRGLFDVLNSASAHDSEGASAKQEGDQKDADVAPEEEEEL